MVLRTHFLVVREEELGVLAPCSLNLVSNSTSELGEVMRGLVFDLSRRETTSHSSCLDRPLANLICIAPSLIALSFFLLVGSVWKEAEYTMSLRPANRISASCLFISGESSISCRKIDAHVSHLSASLSKV